MLKQEWKKLLGNKIMLIVIVAIIAIPTIYTTLFLGSMWDPYGNIDKLPVAVVNEDVPAVYGTSKLHVGDEMVKRIERRQLLYGYHNTGEFFFECRNVDR